MYDIQERWKNKRKELHITGNVCIIIEIKQKVLDLVKVLEHLL